MWEREVDGMSGFCVWVTFRKTLGVVSSKSKRMAQIDKDRKEKRKKEERERERERETEYTHIHTHIYIYIYIYVYIYIYMVGCKSVWQNFVLFIVISIMVYEQHELKHIFSIMNLDVIFRDPFIWRGKPIHVYDLKFTFDRD